MGSTIAGLTEQMDLQIKYLWKASFKILMSPIGAVCSFGLLLLPALQCTASGSSSSDKRNPEMLKAQAHCPTSHISKVCFMHSMPGRPVTCKYGLLCLHVGLLWGIMVCDFGLPSFQGDLRCAPSTAQWTPTQ